MTDVFQFSLVQRPRSGQSVQNGIGVLVAEENRIGKEGKLHLVEAICGLNITSILWILRHTKIIVEFETHFASGF
jgi:hypothetical protein